MRVIIPETPTVPLSSSPRILIDAEIENRAQTNEKAGEFSDDFNLDFTI